MVLYQLTANERIDDIASASMRIRGTELVRGFSLLALFTRVQKIELSM